MRANDGVGHRRRVFELYATIKSCMLLQLPATKQTYNHTNTHTHTHRVRVRRRMAGNMRLPFAQWMCCHITHPFFPAKPGQAITELVPICTALCGGYARHIIRMSVSACRCYAVRNVGKHTVARQSALAAAIIYTRVNDACRRANDVCLLSFRTDEWCV